MAVALTAGAQRAVTANPVPSSPYLVVIVMDGFRPDYGLLAPMRHLRALMNRGRWYDNAWVGQMESETPTGHATIATGVYPRKHGVVGFGWRDAASGRFTFMPTDLRRIRAGDFSRTIEQGGVPSIADLIHARNPRDLSVSMSGEKYYAAAAMGVGADYVFYGKEMKRTVGSGSTRKVQTVLGAVAVGPNVPPAASHYQDVYASDWTPDLQDQFSASLGIQLARTLRPRALLVNLPGADIAGHLYGGIRAPRDMTPIIRGDDWAIGRIVNAYRRLGLLQKTVFVVTADHGMASNRHIVPIHSMYKVVSDAVGPTLDEEFRITVGSIWLQNPQPKAAAAVAAAVDAKRFPYVEGALYKIPALIGSTFVPDPAMAARLPSGLLDAYIHLADTEAGPTGPDVILPYAEDTTGLFLKGKKLWGNHGGFSWGVQHIPLLLAGPGIRPGISHFPAQLIDIAPTIERLMGLPVPAKVDGLVLADALTQPTAAEQSAEQANQGARMHYVSALRRHSQAQTPK